MDVYKILKENSDNILLEDLDFFETEISTGKFYTSEYVQKCKALIEELRNWKKQELLNKGKGKVKQGDVVPVIMELDKEYIDSHSDSTQTYLTNDERLLHEIKELRKYSTYKTRFKKYLKEHDEMNEAFIDNYFVHFKPWEIDTIVSVRKLSEQFLEKYFGAISPDKISRYQSFSESFFMKHFNQLDPELVLSKENNEWCKKENRSTQLDVFLRLKGINK